MLNSILNFLILLSVFLFSVICIRNPFIIIRIQTAWFKFAAGNSFSAYLEESSKLRDVFELINQPDLYASRFPRQIENIHRIGYAAIFISVTGVCLGLFVGAR
jgi:hypothetical protein